MAHLSDEEVHHALARAEFKEHLGLFFIRCSITWLHEILNIQSILSDVVCELLDRLFGPLFDTTEELTLMLFVEIFN